MSEKPHRRAGMERVADRELPGIDEADDVAGVGDARSSRGRGRRTGRRATPGAACPTRLLESDHVLGEPARADADERDAIAVPRIHVRLNLEHEAGEALVGRAHDAGVAQRAAAAAAPARRARCRNGSRPKLVSALPKNTGVCRPARYSAGIERRAGGAR